MALNLMFITNNPDVAQIAERSGIDWIFVDMEFIGKTERQRFLDTVQNHHTIEDIRRVKLALTTSKVLVRINPIHKKYKGYMDSSQEIDAAIDAGADILMLPYFHTKEEVQFFIDCVAGRAKTCLLLETPEAADAIDYILEIKGIDMVHIGLNDLHLAMGLSFMFQLLADGTVDRLAGKIKAKGIPFGFGGIADLQGGFLPGSYVMKEHYRLGSSMVIVGRSFCNVTAATSLDEVRQIFETGIPEIRNLEKEAQSAALDYFEENRRRVVEIVDQIVNYKKN